MPNSIISNKPTIYQFGLYKQYLVVESAASTAFLCCEAIFTTKAFNFDFAHMMYITTIVIIIVINAAVKRSHVYQEAFEKRTKLGAYLGFFYFFLSFFFL